MCRVEIEVSKVSNPRNDLADRNRGLGKNSGNPDPVCPTATVQWKISTSVVSHWSSGPQVGIFLSLLNTNDGFYLSHLSVHLAVCL